MRSVTLALLALAALALGPGSASAQTEPTAKTATVFGVWRNPRNSVHLEIKDCGSNTCGFVVWADANAQADARKGGTANLVGLQLLRDFKPQPNGVWRGKVFVPDLNMTFSGTAEALDANRLRAKGCVLGNLFCKSQIWTRVDASAVVAERATF